MCHSIQSTKWIFEDENFEEESHAFSVNGGRWCGLVLQRICGNAAMLGVESECRAKHRRAEHSHAYHCGLSEGPRFSRQYLRRSTPKFAAIQELNFSNPNAKLTLSRLSDKELNDIAVLYNRSTNNKGGSLLRILAKRLDGVSLTRVAKAFGGVATQQAVVAYGSPTVQKEYFTRMSAIPSVPAFAKTTLTAEATTMAGPVPNSDMTLREIYLEFRGAPVGGLSPASALSETLMYSGARLAAAWGFGYAIGTGIHSLIENYAPQFDVVLGGTIQQAYDNIDAASTEYDQGIQEKGADALFDGTMYSYGYSTGDYSGDYGAGDSFDFYEVGGGCD